MRKGTWYILGVISGVVGPKILKKTQFVEAAKYFREAVHARERLQKIAVEEYYRIDEAIETELYFLEAIKPKLSFAKITLSFRVEDDDKRRIVKLSINGT